ncbi:MAG: hypothetical protein R3C56_14675 [Pirellulaceae bacterium]
MNIEPSGVPDPCRVIDQRTTETAGDRISAGEGCANISHPQGEQFTICINRLPLSTG